MAYSKAYLINTVAIKGMHPIFLYALVGFEPTTSIGALYCFSFQTLLTAPLGHIFSIVETVQ